RCGSILNSVYNSARKHQVHIGVPLSLWPVSSTFRRASPGSTGSSSRYGPSSAALTLAMTLASWPREMLSPTTSPRNLRTVEYEAWQAPFLDGRWQRGLVRLLTAHTPILGTGMLFDGQRRFRDIDLLHDTGQVPIPAQAAAATRTDLKQVFLKVADLLGGKRNTF